MEINAKNFWTEVAMDIIQKTNPELYSTILFRDNNREQPYQDQKEVSEIAQILHNLNLDIKC